LRVRCCLPARGFKDIRQQINSGEWKQGVRWEDLK
jgi:hypothetical protein